ncbi:4706_t:CDS:10 [Ambispora gerdemannii]|uniref:Structural maintenance of chromosomes protein n=1 Tax=Ambispora gerdemannii TaxID=144530 RepID=A0A9N9A864_9GLOM|nr:4706_t:CDS:10 [Ambispora gerdemannii]
MATTNLNQTRKLSKESRRSSIQSVAQQEAKSSRRSSIQSVAQQEAESSLHSSIQSVAQQEAKSSRRSSIQSVAQQEAKSSRRSSIQSVAQEAKSSRRSSIQSVAQQEAKSSRRSSIQSVAQQEARSSRRSSTRSTHSLKNPLIESCTTRLVISKLVLINFKSYAGRQEIGPFHKSFTSVVGPNGSGKSNVIDALLFVFGYRANKMRQAKLSGLIHSSQGHENLDSCTVQVHFHEIYDMPEPNEYEVVPNSQLVISRQAFRNNISKYFINNDASNYTEVTALLKERGIDLDHKRFLILQAVESISQMKPKALNEHEDGLLEYLEDIIGTSKYKAPIEEASNQVEKLDDERSEKLNRVKIVEKEKQSLEGEKAKAEMFLRDENILTTKKSFFYQRQLLECKNNIDIATEAVNEWKGKLNEEQRKHAHIIEETKKLQDDVDETSQEYNLEKYEKEDIGLQEKKKHSTTKQKKLIKTLEKDRASLSITKTSIQYHEEDLVKRERELGQLEKSLQNQEAELEKIRQSLKGKTEVYSAQIEEKQKELAPWTEKINAKQSNIDVLRAEYEIIEGKTRAIQSSLEQAENEIITIEETRNSKKTDIEAALALKEKLADEVKQIERKLKNNIALHEGYQNNLKDARQKASEADIQLKQAESRGAVLKSLLKLKESGRIKGLHDRLGNLGVIDDRYDIAISTACSALDNIVVDTVDDAQACIEYLRRNNLGRATFVVLNQLASMNMGKIDTPENVPRLFDLVKPKEPQFAQAFFNVLRNTLVARNLEHANRIAFGRQRWRVVTLDGKLIDVSGTMTGGGTKVMKGGMSSKFVPDITPTMVDELIRAQTRCEEKWRELQMAHQELESELERKKAEAPKVDLDISKLKMDIDSNKKRMSDAQKRVIELRQRNKSNPEDSKRKQQLQSTINKLTQELENLKTHPASIEQEIKDLQQKILDVGGGKLRSQKAKVDEMQEQIDSHNDRITTLQVTKTKAEKDIIKLQNSIEKSENEAEELSLEIKQLEEEMQEKVLESREIRKKARQSEDLTEKRREDLEKIQKELDSKTEVINKIRAVEVELKNRLEDNERHLAENQLRYDHWRSLHGKLSLHQINGGEDCDESDGVELQIYTDDELSAVNKENLKKEIDELEERLQKTQPNLKVLVEYRQHEEEYISRARDLEEITTSRDAAKKEYDELRKQRLEKFMQGFTLISQKLKEMYQIITMGGNAELELVDSLDPFSEGILFSVMPPKKSWKNISNLSVFALHHFKPTPLYVMDEIDAALDFRNVSIVANYIKERTKNAQFIIISLRNNMFELADRLVGIYKTNNMTKSISISPESIM